MFWPEHPVFSWLLTQQRRWHRRTSTVSVPRWIDLVSRSLYPQRLETLVRTNPLCGQCFKHIEKHWTKSTNTDKILSITIRPRKPSTERAVRSKLVQSKVCHNVHDCFLSMSLAYLLCISLWTVQVVQVAVWTVSFGRRVEKPFGNWTVRLYFFCHTESDATERNRDVDDLTGLMTFVPSIAYAAKLGRETGRSDIAPSGLSLFGWNITRDTSINFTIYLILIRSIIWIQISTNGLNEFSNQRLLRNWSAVFGSPQK